MAFHRRGRATLEDDSQPCPARQARHTERYREGRGVSRVRRQQLYHGNGVVCGWRLRTSVSRQSRGQSDSARPTSFAVLYMSAVAEPVNHRGFGGAELDPFRAIELHPFVELFGVLEGLLAHLFEPVELALKRELA